MRIIARRLCAVVFLAVLLSQQTSTAQEFQFGRTPQGQVPSGSASEFLNINAEGLGVNTRLGHVAGNDVGRTESLSILQMSPYVNIGDGLFFGDGRFNYANNGEIAYSMGAGYRHYITAWDAVVGGYGYYDWDQLTGADFRQWSYGFELLSHRWEARGNVYRPYGNTSQLTGSRVDSTSAAFIDNRLEFNQIDSFAEALRGFDAEVGFLLPGELSERIDLRAFGGGYGYEGDGNGYFSGFSTRLQADIRDTVELGIKVTHDRVLNTNFLFSAIVHLGGYHSQAHTSRSAIQRMAEPVRRNLNIAAAQNDVTRGGVIATAADGTQLDIIHVNSNATSPGTGTVLDPFRSLTQGLNTPGADLIFTHAGSTYDSLGVTLKPDQSLFGEGFVPDRSAAVVNNIQIPGVGSLALPASPTFAADPTLLRPTLTNSPDPAVVMANNSRFGGFIIENATGVGILADGVSGFSINDVLVSNSAGDGVLLNNVTGLASLSNVGIDGATGAAFHVVGGTGRITFSSTSTVNDPAFGFIQNSSGAAVLVQNTLAGATLDMTTSTIDDTGGMGVIIDNAAGNATFDNLNVNHSTAAASTSSGILITGGSSGSLTFNNTLRGATTIDSVGLGAIVVEDFAGTVQFQDVAIANPLAGGIDIDRLTGRFVVQGATTIGVAAAGSTAPFVSVQGSQGTTNFGTSLTINGGVGGSGGDGIELTGNLAGNIFDITGAANIQNVDAVGISIVDDASLVSFNALTVADPGLQGLLVNNTTGILQFQQTALFSQLTNGVSPVIDIQTALAPVSFDTLNVNATTGVVGVQLLNNDGENSRISIVELDVITTGGTGLSADNNRLIQTFGGSVDATAAAAIEILDSGINVTLDSVFSTNSPTFGIHLQDTNKDLTNHPIVAKTFVVRPGGIADPAFGDGGAITGANAEGVLLENAGQIELNAMDLFDNEFGIRVANSNLLFVDDELVDEQFLLLADMQIFDSNVRGLDTTNLTLLRMIDSSFVGNGDVAVIGRESVQLRFNEWNGDTDRNRVTEYAEENRFAVEILRTSFTDDTDDVISINNFGAEGAPIVMDISSNEFILTDANDFDPADITENGIEIFWNGPAGINLSNNQFTLAGTVVGEPQTAILLDSLSTTDLMDLNIDRNSIINTTQPGAVGLNIQTRGDLQAGISNNNFTFTGEESTGMLFNLADNAAVNLVSNTLRFLGSGGFGMDFTRVNGPSTFGFSGNLIQLTDVLTGTGLINDPPNEEGIRFRAISGTINLFGAQNNIIELISPNGDIDVFFSPAIPTANINGGIFVNGVFGP